MSLFNTKQPRLLSLIADNFGALNLRGEWKHAEFYQPINDTQLCREKWI